MPDELAEKEAEDLSYDQRMDQLLVQLNKAASRNGAKKRSHIVIGVVIVAAVALVVYHVLRQAATGGQFMGFLDKFM